MTAERKRKTKKLCLVTSGHVSSGGLSLTVSQTSLKTTWQTSTHLYLVGKDLLVNHVLMGILGRQKKLDLEKLSRAVTHLPAAVVDYTLPNDLSLGLVTASSLISW